MKSENNTDWDLVVSPKAKWYQLDLGSIWRYKDLLFLLVRRDFVSVYKQTLLGPVWFIIQPVITTLIFTIIFGNLAKISTDGVPPTLFYMAGITLWTYFADCLNKTSNTFVANAAVFGKVYFPRLIVPLSVLISNLGKLAIQLLLFICFWFYYINTTTDISPQWHLMWVLPILIIILAALGLGFGILISSLTTKYRDLVFLVGFGVQLLMYASPVVYPMSIVSEKYKFWLLLNPLSSIMESFKFIFIGTGQLNFTELSYSLIFSIVLVIISVIVFHKVEKSFMDTV